MILVLILRFSKCRNYRNIIVIQWYLGALLLIVYLHANIHGERTGFHVIVVILIHVTYYFLRLVCEDDIYTPCFGEKSSNRERKSNHHCQGTHLMMPKFCVNILFKLSFSDRIWRLLVLVTIIKFCLGMANDNQFVVVVSNCIMFFSVNNILIYWDARSLVRFKDVSLGVSDVTEWYKPCTTRTLIKSLTPPWRQYLDSKCHVAMSI